MSNKIVKKFLKKFIENHTKDNIKVEGILGFGSRFNRGTIGVNADLDLFVVIKNINKRYRGVMVIDDIPVDYFVNSLDHLKKMWENFKKGTMTSNTILYMLKDGKILLDNGNHLKKLKAEAQKFFKKSKRNKKITKDDLIIKKYFIEDYLKDIEDSLDSKNIEAWQYNVNLLMNYLVEFICILNRIPLKKPKYLMEDIYNKDKKFIELYNSIARASNISTKTRRIKDLVFYCLNLVGGMLPKEWEIEQKLK